MEFMVSKTAFRSENDWIRTTREVQIMPLEWRIHARQPSQSGAANWPVRMTCFLFISLTPFFDRYGHEKLDHCLS